MVPTSVLLFWTWSVYWFTFVYFLLCIQECSDAGKDWGSEENGARDDEMVGWHHWLNGLEFKQTQGDSEGQRSLTCCSHGVTNNQTWLSDWITTIFHLYLSRAFAIVLRERALLVICVCVYLPELFFCSTFKCFLPLIKNLYCPWVNCFFSS